MCPGHTFFRFWSDDVPRTVLRQKTPKELLAGKAGKGLLLIENGARCARPRAPRSVTFPLAVPATRERLHSTHTTIHTYIAHHHMVEKSKEAEGPRTSVFRRWYWFPRKNLKNHEKPFYTLFCHFRFHTCYNDSVTRIKPRKTDIKPR